MSESTDRDEPLTPVVFHVLVALAEGPRHGYGIMKKVEEDAGTPMGPGTVYGSLQRLEEAGWVTDQAPPGDGSEEQDPRRGKTFRLTPRGREALEIELARLERLTRLARERGLAARSGSGA